jgi:hypothetical protein
MRQLTPSEYRMYAACIISNKVATWDEEECDNYLQSHDEKEYTDKTLETIPLNGYKGKRQLITAIEGAEMMNAPIEDVVITYGEDILYKRTVDKVREAVHNGRLNLEKGSRTWYGIPINVTPLVWARNFADGYDVDVYIQTGNGREKHLETLKFR